MTHDILICLWLLNGKRLRKFLRWLFLDMICLQNHHKVDRKKWRHDVIIVTSTLTLWHKITFILYEKIFASTKSAFFSIAPGPIHKIQLIDFDLAQPRDTVTSWRHGMTQPNLFSLSQLVDVLERWFFFCFYETLGCWVRKCCQFCICIMTSRHDVMSWRQKQAVLYLSL